jgi:hypothetical protein
MLVARRATARGWLVAGLSFAGYKHPTADGECGSVLSQEKPYFKIALFLWPRSLIMAAVLRLYFNLLDERKIVEPAEIDSQRRIPRRWPASSWRIVDLKTCTICMG